MPPWIGDTSGRLKGSRFHTQKGLFVARKAAFWAQNKPKLGVSNYQSVNRVDLQDAHSLRLIRAGRSKKEVFWGRGGVAAFWDFRVFFWVLIDAGGGLAYSHYATFDGNCLQKPMERVPCVARRAGSIAISGCRQISIRVLWAGTLRGLFSGANRRSACRT
jgi:hypothetical protein